MYHLLIFILFTMARCWGQSAESLRGLDLRIESQGRHVQFGITPEAFEKVADYLETHPTQHFFIEDTQGARYLGTVTYMDISLTPPRVVFNGLLDQPLSSFDKDIKVYLNLG